MKLKQFQFHNSAPSRPVHDLHPEQFLFHLLPQQLQEPGIRLPE